MTAWLADVLVVLGLSVLTIAVVGMLRLPTPLMRVHAGGKAATAGILPLALAAAVSDVSANGPGAALLAIFLLFTAPVGSHLVARAAHAERADD